MYKVFDFVCTTKKCKQKDMPVEVLVHDNEICSVICEACLKAMDRQLAPTYGKVKGTTNPTKVKR